MPMVTSQHIYGSKYDIRMFSMNDLLPLPKICDDIQARKINILNSANVPQGYGALERRWNNMGKSTTEGNFRYKGKIP